MALFHILKQFVISPGSENGFFTGSFMIDTIDNFNKKIIKYIKIDDCLKKMFYLVYPDQWQADIILLMHH